MEVGRLFDLVDPVGHFRIFGIVCVNSVDNIRYILSTGQIAKKSIELVDLFLISVVFGHLSMGSLFLAKQDLELKFEGGQLGVGKGLELYDFLFDIFQVSFYL